MKARVYLSGGFGLAASVSVTLLVPLHASAVGISISLIGVLLAARPTAEAVFSIPLGRLIDRMGARRVFIIGCSICAMVNAGYPLASSFWQFITLQALFGIGRSMGWVASQVYVSTRSTGDTQARDMGRFTFIGYVSLILAPMLTGIVAEHAGFAWAFVGVSGYCATFGLLGMILPDDGDSSYQLTPRVSVVALIRDRAMRGGLMLSFTRLWISSTWLSFYPLFLIASGYTASLAGLAVSVSALVATVTPLSVRRLVRWRSAEKVTILALLVSATGLAVSGLLESEALVLLPAVLLGVAGVSLPLLITLISNAAPNGSQGAALGIRAAVNQTSAALAPLAAAPIIGGLGFSVGFPISAGIAMLILLWAWFDDPAL